MIHTTPQEMTPNPISIMSGDYQTRLADQLDKYGYARFSDMKTTEQLLDLAADFGEVRVHPMTDERGVTTLTTFPQDTMPKGTFGTDSELYPHVDGAAVTTPAALIMVRCVKPDATGGGVSKVVDGRRLYHTLETQHPDLLELALDPTSVMFGPHDEQHHIGGIFEQDEKSGLTSIRYRLDNRTSFTGPLALRLAELSALIKKHEGSFTLGECEGYIINNRHLLHARSAITGPRTIERVHVDPTEQAPYGHRVNLGFVPKLGSLGLGSSIAR